MDFLPPNLKMMILGHTDQKTREEVMKVRPEAGVVPVPLFSKLRSPEDTGADSEPKDTFFSTDELQKLETRGFIVKDGFSSADLTLLREEVTAMKTGGTLKSANMSSSVAETWNDPKTRGDLHHWLNEDKERINSEYPQLGALLQAMDNLRVELNERCDFNSSKTQTQIALYPGQGARYVRHLDSTPNGPDRRLTCLFYLNENWKPENGGSLRVFLKKDGDSAQSEGEETSEDIEPLINRLVIFQSRTIPHEVLPAFSDRMAITMWFY